jgi:hypothetical protein
MVFYFTLEVVEKELAGKLYYLKVITALMVDHMAPIVNVERINDTLY